MKTEDSKHCDNAPKETEEIKICFTPKPFCPMGYIADNGKMY